MSDIELELGGNANGAVNALNETAGATEKLNDKTKKLDESLVKMQQATAQGDAQREKSAETWNKIATATAAATAAVVAFGVKSVQAFMEADRVSQQLKRAAGDYADVLDQQAAAMQELYAVDDDLIKQQQVLLTQWGGVGAASQDTTTAILNYAAATGTDAVAATQDLIRNVESGGKQFERLGVHFDATGDKAEDLKRAVAALNAKFGGAAEADANSLHGNLAAVSNAFSDLQEHIGGAIAKFNEQYAITYKLTEALKGLDTFLFGDQAEEKRQERLKVEEQLNDRIAYRKELMEQIARANATPGREGTSKELMQMLADNEKAIGQLKTWKQEYWDAVHAGPPEVTGRTKTGREADAAAAKEDADAMDAYRKKHLSGLEDSAEALKSYTDVMAAESVKQEKILEDSIAAEKEMRTNAAAERRKASDAESAAALDSYKQTETLRRQQNAQLLELEKKQQESWAQAGANIGAAFVTALSDQLQRLASGEDLDAGEAIANVIGDVLAVAGTVIGTAVGGAYGNAQLGAAIGGAAGGLTGAGVKALGRAGARSSKRYHDGGWPRAHGGAWMGVGPDEVPVITQEGERVLSRSEVGNMGGPRVVDTMARGGGGGLTINLSTFDAKSTREFFENDGGRGLYNALRTGRGSLAPAFGGG